MSADDNIGKMLYGQHIDAIRDAEIPDLESQVYLDSSGLPAVPRSVLNAVHKRLLDGPMVSNPHSNSPSGRNTKDELDQVRSLVCRELFKVDRRGGRLEETRIGQGDEVGWELVFTSGATASLQNVAQCFHFEGMGRFAYLQESHSSLFGLRDIVRTKGCDVLQEEEVVQWVEEHSRSDDTHLLALPLQCNATGKRYNKLISSVLDARRKAESEDPLQRRKVYLLLDIASYLSPSTNLPLDSNSIHQADFLCFSFLKILGYPSGLGGLLLLRESSSVLLKGKQYYGGGSLEAVTSRQRWRKSSREIQEALEDGTQNLFGIIAVKSAMEALRSDKVLKSWEQASDYVDSLTDHLYKSLQSLVHGNGSPLIELYSQQAQAWSKEEPSCGYHNFHLPKKSQGPILLFNVLRSEWNHVAERGSLRVDPSEVDRLACIENIHIRSGRMCNIGAITKALDLDEEDIQSLWKRGIGCGSVVASRITEEELDVAEEERLQGLVSGCLRVSLSAWNTMEDLKKLVTFLEKYFVEEELDEVSEYGSCDDGRESEDGCYECDDSDSERGKDSSEATSDTSHFIHQEEGHYLKELHLYPIKSCAFQQLTGPWKLTTTGLEWDRRFCIVDVGNGKVMSQKQVPAMARIQPRICIDEGKLEIALIGQDGKVERELTIPLNFEVDCNTTAGRGFDMCGKTLRPTLFTEESIRGPLSTFLNRDCTLARYPSHQSHHEQDRTPLLFSNESPFLLITSESIQQVCRWIELEEEKEAKEEVVGLAFRSNFIIASHQSTSPFYEEGSNRITIGSHTFTVMGPCRRCQMIALDQRTGSPASEVLSVVARHCRCTKPGALKGRLLFGLHLLWQSEWTDEVTIRPGMSVRIS